MITESPTGMITDNLELTTESEAPAFPTATAKTKKPMKNNKPSAAPNKNVSVEKRGFVSETSKIRLMTEAVK